MVNSLAHTLEQVLMVEVEGASVGVDLTDDGICGSRLGTCLGLGLVLRDVRPRPGFRGVTS